MAEACNGIRYLLSLGFVAVVFAYLSDAKPWMRVALLAAAVPVAILANAMSSGQCFRAGAGCGRAARFLRLARFCAVPGDVGDGAPPVECCVCSLPCLTGE